MVRWAEVYLNRLKSNYESLRKLLKGKKLIAVVKANAYGHGSVEVSKFLERETDVDAFAVATFDEGRELRESGIKREIIVMSTPIEMGVDEIRELRLTPVVFDFESLKLAKELSTPFQIKLDTGMGRLGFTPDEWNTLLEKLEGSKVCGVMSHFPCADEDEAFTKKQFRDFTGFVRRAEEVLGKRLSVHMDNSAALRFRFNSVLTHSRVGIALYGSYPSGNFPVKLEQVMEVKSKVIQVKELPEGFGISYGRTYITKRRERVAVVAFGYADGLPRAVSNRGHLIVNGRRCPIRGRVCMDMTVVSLNGNASKGDVAVISDRRIRFEKIADIAGTIPYEVMCGISPRVKRVFIE